MSRNVLDNFKKAWKQLAIMGAVSYVYTTYYTKSYLKDYIFGKDGKNIYIKLR